MQCPISIFYKIFMQGCTLILILIMNTQKCGEMSRLAILHLFPFFFHFLFNKLLSFFLLNMRIWYVKQDAKQNSEKHIEMLSYVFKKRPAEKMSSFLVFNFMGVCPGREHLPAPICIAHPYVCVCPSSIRNQYNSGEHVCVFFSVVTLF